MYKYIFYKVLCFTIIFTLRNKWESCMTVKYIGAPLGHQRNHKNGPVQLSVVLCVFKIGVIVFFLSIN